jgi:hypothetical protein
MKKNIRIKEKKHEEGGGEGDESFYHKPRYLVVMMKSKRKRWVQHTTKGKGGEILLECEFQTSREREETI